MTEQLPDYLKVVNDALAMIGAGKISALDEDSELADQVVAIFFLRLYDSLGKYHWSFAGQTYKLDKIAETASNGFDTVEQKFATGWRYAFAAPGTAIGEPRAILADPRRHDWLLRDFMVEQGRIYADREQLWGSFTVEADPKVWKPDFRRAVTKLCAADFCVPVTHDSQLASLLLEEGEGSPSENGRGGLIGRAMGADASGSRNQRPMWTDPLTSAHMW